MPGYHYKHIRKLLKHTYALKKNLYRSEALNVVSPWGLQDSLEKQLEGIIDFCYRVLNNSLRFK